MNVCPNIIKPKSDSASTSIAEPRLSVKPRPSRRTLCFGVLGSMLLAGSPWVFAQNRGGLYDPEPPADSSYVRLVVVGAEQTVDIFVDDKPHSVKLGSGELSDYMVLTGGKRTISLHLTGKSSPVTSYSLEIPKGKALTLAFASLKPGIVPTIFEDKANTNKLKAVLAAYHLDSKAGPLDVLTADGATKVFSNLNFGSSNSIQVNPITVDLIAAKSGTTSAHTGAKAASLSMSQGATYSVLFIPDSQGKLSTRTFQNKTERYLGKP